MKILLRRRPHPFDGVISPPQLLNIFKIIIFFWVHYIHICRIYFSFLQSYRAKSKNLFSPSISTSDDLQCPSTTSTTSTAGPNNPNMLSQSLSVGGLQSNTPSLAAIHSNSCGSPNNFNNLSARDISGLGGNSTENSLKVTKSSKPVNRWSGLWGSSSKVKLTNITYLSQTCRLYLELHRYCYNGA